MRTISLVLGIVTTLFFAANQIAHAKPPIEAYGELPSISSMELSPDGTKLAYAVNENSVSAIMLHDLKSGESTPLGNTTGIKGRGIEFAGADHLIIHASRTLSQFGYRGRFEYSGAISIDLKSGKTIQLVANKTDDLHPAQSGIGRIVGKKRDDPYVWMPAYIGTTDRATFSLLRVNLNSGRGRRKHRGNSKTIDWVVSPDGIVYMREDFDNKKNVHSVHTNVNGEWTKIYEDQTEQPSISILGVNQSKDALIFSGASSDTDFHDLYEMSLEDGSISGPIISRDDASIDAVLTDINRVVHGVRFSGLWPRYEFFDAELTADIRSIQQQFGASAVYMDSWSDDWSKVLLRVEGGELSGLYLYFDRISREAQAVASSRPQIKSEDVADSFPIEYTTRDGMKINAIVTWPPNIVEEERKNLPIVMLPHGGPEAYDSIGFDWMAQYFASEGYMVMQPNFRGSSGFGREHLRAGRGEWGRAMQDDVTDGLQVAINMGWADPSRACIVGWSYGGYSALAGGAFTPDLYKCVIAGSGVSDLPEMLKTERFYHGSDHWVYSYWKDLIGDPRFEKDHLKNISPRYHADKFQAPVLLIHGKDDLVVKINQSRRMEDALEDAGKEVEFVQLKGEDHWLSSSETRLAALEAMGDFLREHLN